jgi:molybdate transport system substrate-binding protein
MASVLAPHMSVPQRARTGLCIALFLALLADCQQGATRGDEAAGEVRIAAAASLSLAFRELESAFERAHGRTVTVVYGASGALAAQLAQGAPFDAFYSADETFASQVIAAGACDGATRRVYAQGHLVVWTRQPESEAPLVDLSSLLGPSYERIAIADPDKAPYGRAARETLQRAGLWDALASRIVLSEDIQKTFQQVDNSQADAALVSMSLVLYQGGRFVSVDDSLHAPLTQVSVQCRHGKNPGGARAFDAFVASEQGAEILRRHGYVLSAP